jgi:hypothetical protein
MSHVTIKNIFPLTLYPSEMGEEHVTCHNKKYFPLTLYPSEMREEHVTCHTMN